ncbi:esterase/lipase family protein [uncultured Psychrobacter sp.]|uniref:esterase/lipase family protein n=1 Tax=uncultured Psychrobacter sp. TaxID=259303 RepID=UPI00345A181D
MSSIKTFDTIHDLFAGKRRYATTHLDNDPSIRYQDDVYEQLAQLEYIYVDELTEQIASGSDDLVWQKPLSLADFFEGLTQLAAMGVVEVTDIVEAIHREILLRPLGRFNEGNLNKWQRGITGRIYGTVRQAMSLIGNNLVSGLRLYNNVRNQSFPRPLPETIRQLVNILNGVMGDHLVNHNNPLAIPMVLYDHSLFPIHENIPHRKISGRVIILCHGLCMSHLSWQPFEPDSLGKRIGRSQLDATVLYLNYNTGRRISSNGRNFAKVIQQLIDDHPDIMQIDLIGHSMGGLVARSALFYGSQARQDWVNRVGNLITLGSPHHGAVLERIGNFVQDVISKLPFAGALAKLGDLRSAGIIDLRHGSVRDADWQSLKGRSVLPPDFRHPTPLPRHVYTYFIASTLAEAHYDAKTTKLLGDGLVTIESALGEDEDEHTLLVPEGHKAIFYGISHYNLIYSSRVHKQIIAWLLDNGQSDYLLSPRIYSYPKNVEVVI